MKAKTFREREVTVGKKPWTLPGTLSVPVGEGFFPAVVLVHGSGPAGSRRNYSQRPALNRAEPTNTGVERG